MGTARRTLPALVLALAALVTVGGGPAAACSPAVPPEQFLDRSVSQSAIVAEGWVEAISPRVDLPSGIEDRYGSDLFVPVEMLVRVVRVHKGTVVNPLVFYGHAARRTDGHVGRRTDGALEFPGTGSCLWPEGDPSGKYALLVLQRSRQQRLIATALSGTVVYDSPADAGLDGDRLQVTRRIPTGTPADLSDSANAADAAPDYGRAAFAALPLGLLAGAALLLLGRVGRRTASRPS